jgi:hypothetical protein
MRNIFMALLATLVLLLGACNTSTPKVTNTCPKNDTDCTIPDDGDPNNGGENPGGENPGGENPGGENPGGENPAVFDHSLMKGFVKYLDGKDYLGDEVLYVKALWIDQSTGEIVKIGGGPDDKGSRLEQDGEFGVQLTTPSYASLATVPVISPITCDKGSIVTTTVPENLSSVQGLIVPVLFVVDQHDQLVGLIAHGSIHLDENEQLRSGKLAMRVYSAADKIISKGTCSGEVALDSLTSMSDVALGNALKQLGATNVNATQLAQVMTSGQMMAANAAPASSSLTVNLDVNLGLKKGWNTVVLGASYAGNTLDVSLIDDTKPNFTWYFLDFAQFTLPVSVQ